MPESAQPGYDPGEDHERCLAVYRGLRDAVAACAPLAAGHRNLAALLFPRLMALVTGLVLRERERGGPGPPLAPHGAFPALGWADPARGEAPRVEHAPPARPRAVARLAARLATLVARGRRVAVYNPGFPIGALARALVRMGLAPTLPHVGKLAMPSAPAQLEVLGAALAGLLDDLDLGRYRATLRTLLSDYCAAYVDAAADPGAPPAWDLVLCGTLQKVPARVLAARARAHGRPVVVVSHGEGDQLIADEPRIGYGEATYATELVGYGPAGAAALARGAYTHSLFPNEAPRYVASRSTVCARLFDPDAPIPSLAEAGGRVMYVPTTYVGPLRYGPFHSLPDADYARWQRVVHALYPQALYKRHPKLLARETPFARVQGGELAACLDRADVFVFDVVTTAFHIAAATDKPIVYFELGLRNLHGEARARVRERCVVVDARGGWSVDRLRAEVARQARKPLANAFTPAYSLGGPGEARIRTVARTAREALRTTGRASA